MIYLRDDSSLISFSASFKFSLSIRFCSCFLETKLRLGPLSVWVLSWGRELIGLCETFLFDLILVSWKTPIWLLLEIPTNLLNKIEFSLLIEDSLCWDMIWWIFILFSIIASLSKSVFFKIFDFEFDFIIFLILSWCSFRYYWKLINF